MIDRESAFELVKQHVPQRNLVSHMLAVEAVMRSLARRLGEDEELWGLTGLLHDLDYAVTEKDPDRHSLVTCELLKDSLPDEALHAIQAHAEQVPIAGRFDSAIYCADPVTGLIVAAALMHPSKKLREVDPQFLGRRFREKRFAAGADREQIATCSRLDIELDEFLTLALEAMQGISEELGL